MKKIASILFLFLVLAVVIAGCSRGSQQAVIQTQETTPIDSEFSGADSDASDLNDSDFNDVDGDLEEIENL